MRLWVKNKLHNSLLATVIKVGMFLLVVHLIKSSYLFKWDGKGSAHDTIVWKDALGNPQFGFPHPYSNPLGHMAPFSGTRAKKHVPPLDMHLLEVRRSILTSLRMKIEGAFGQLKSTWKVLKRIPQIEDRHQMSIIVACFTLHNFIRMQELGIHILDHEPSQGASDFTLFDEHRKMAMAEVREGITEQIWNSVVGDTSEIESSDID
ncbi:hypothetical protein OROGR_018245 [Orobanche gracilis]